MRKELMKEKIKFGAITAVVIVGLMIASAFVSAATRTTRSSSFSEKKINSVGDEK